MNYSIYDLILVDRRTEILPLATSHIADLCNQFNRAFALLIFMPHFKRISFYQNTLKIKEILLEINLLKK